MLERRRHHAPRRRRRGRTTSASTSRRSTRPRCSRCCASTSRTRATWSNSPTAAGSTRSTSTTGTSPAPRACSFEELARQPVCRVVVVSPGKSEDDFVDLVARIGLNQVSYAIGWTAWLDIAPMGVDKGTALERVRDWLGVDPAHVLVDRRRAQRRRHVPLGARERRAGGGDGAGSAGGAGCRGRDHRVGRRPAESPPSCASLPRSSGPRTPRAAASVQDLSRRPWKNGLQACRLDSMPVRRMPRPAVVLREGCPSGRWTWS